MESKPGTSHPEGYIPTHSSATSRADLHCCCGQKECVFLQHNHDALEGLEKDLETAARLGQALLHRHESYMAEAEEDRRRLLANIETLEREKRQVEAENARIVEVNRNLLDELEGLNKALADSDSYAKTLAVKLERNEAELRTLTALAARAADLEAQLALLEAEQTNLQDSLLTAQEDSKSAMDRWKKAECMIRDLNDQVDRMEKEASEERERHAEVVQRMERRRMVERELDGAAGRLKGAAAAQNLTRAGGSSVVSRFVKDILQDNANLQMGIVELREMLENSNQEVQELRDQILSHQPLAPPAEGDRPTTTLSQEIEAKESRRVSQEFHIHHHYHTPPVPRKEKSTLFRRSKKRRSLGNPPMHFNSDTQSFRKTKHRSQPSVSSASTILSQTSVSIPPPASHRWSLQSPVPPDSMASSPQSAYRSSMSIFDRVDRGFDTSQPTSPDSATFTSPLRNDRFKGGGSSDAYRTLDRTDDRPMSDGEYSEFHLQSAIPEETEDTTSVSRPESPAVGDDIFSTSTPYRRVRRATSHESLFSVAGMDIHTPSHCPSRMSDFRPGALPLRVQRRILSSDLASTPPTTSTITVTAGRDPTKASPLHQSPQSLLASVAGSQQAHHQEEADSHTTQTSMDDSALTSKRILSIGSRVGGWVRGRWGTAPTSSPRRGLKPLTETDETSVSPAQSCAFSTHSAEQQTPSSTPQPQKQPLLRFRHPGINQKGPIMGFRPPPPPPISIHAEQIDEGLLRESLAE